MRRTRGRRLGDSEPDNSMPAVNSSMYKLIRFLQQELFVAEKRRLDKTVADIIRANNREKGVSAAGFLHMGEYYTASGFQQVGNAQKYPLEQSLVDRMDAHLKDAETVAIDEQQIGQIIFKLLDPCETLQAVRDTLPECLATIIPALNPLTRMNEPGDSLRHDTRASKQFEKLLPKIEMYAACRLIY